MRKDFAFSIPISGFRASSIYKHPFRSPYSISENRSLEIASVRISISVGFSG